jgi:hypothetical protein
MSIDLMIYAKEFTAIVKALLRDEKGFIKRNFLYTDKNIIDEMLKKNPYATISEKLSNWRGLCWIGTDEGHFTCKVIINNERVRKVKINLRVYEKLTELTAPPVSQPSYAVGDKKKSKGKPKTPRL